MKKGYSLFREKEKTMESSLKNVTFHPKSLALGVIEKSNT